MTDDDRPAELRTAEVDHRGLLRVLGENLYSTPAVAVRELVQNAHDSITRRLVESTDGFTPRIDVIGAPQSRTLTVRDNGAGLTREEIHAYLATIGAGYTRVLRQETSDERFIGAFGLGFLAAYVVSDRVEVLTTSHRAPGEAWLFRSADGLRYSVSAAPPREVGTEVTLYLRESHEDLADAAILSRLLLRYAQLLAHPVYAPHRINGGAAPWRSASDHHPRRRRRELLELARAFDPSGIEPLAAFPVEPGDDPAGVEVRGMLWVQGGFSYATSDNRRASLYVRGMFVSDEVRAILPEWAGFVGGILECNALTPTASREDVQRDEVFAQVQQRVAEQLIAGLCALASEEPEAWRRTLLRHADGLRGAALADERLLRALGDEVPVPTSEGDLTLPEITAGGRLYATAGDDSGYELVLHRALGRPVIDGTRYGALALAERWGAARGQPVVILGTEAGAREMFPHVPVAPEVRARLERWFGSVGLGVVATRFAPATVSILLVPNRDVLLKRRIEDDQADRRITQGVLGLARLYTAPIEDGPEATLYVNLDSPVIARLLDAAEADADAVAAVLLAFADSSGRRNTDGVRRDLASALASLQAALLTLMG